MGLATYNWEEGVAKIVSILEVGIFSFLTAENVTAVTKHPTYTYTPDPLTQCSANLFLPEGSHDLVRHLLTHGLTKSPSTTFLLGMTMLSILNRTAEQICMAKQLHWVLMAIHLDKNVEVITANKNAISKPLKWYYNSDGPYGFGVFILQWAPWGVFHVSCDWGGALGTHGRFGWQATAASCLSTQASHCHV